MFTAERGKGAFLNDRRIRVAARTELADCVIVTGIPHRGKPGQDLFLREMGAVMSVTAGVRRTGAAALDLAWVAAGRFDGFWERNLRAWDLAAGIVILREAGGFVSDADGKDKMLETGSVVAGNETIQRKLLKQLKTAASPRDAVPAADPSR
jgi:myo-inositol-1(or 4)-monophosphatase